MQLTPYLGDTPIESDKFRCEPDPRAIQRITGLISRTWEITQVGTEAEAQLATRVAGEIRDMEEEINLAKRQTKNPIRAIENGIEAVAKELLGPVLEEKRRIGNLLSLWVQKKEAELAEERQKAREALRAAEEAQRKAEQAQRQAEDESARLKAEQAMIEAQIIAGMQAQQLAESMEQKAKLPGTKVSHPYHFRLVNLKAVVAAGLEGIILRVELDVLACNDMVRTQLAQGKAEPEIPGVEITQETVVHVRAMRR
jgi:signal transduction histidine kinase